MSTPTPDLTPIKDILGGVVKEAILRAKLRPRLEAERRLSDEEFIIIADQTETRI